MSAIGRTPSSTASAALGKGNWAKMCGISPSRQAPRSPFSAATPSSTPFSPPIWPSSIVRVHVASARPGIRHRWRRRRRATRLGMHLGRHGRERVNPFDAEGPGKLDQPVTEDVSAHGRLGFADEHDEIVLRRADRSRRRIGSAAAGPAGSGPPSPRRGRRQTTPGPGTRPGCACRVSPSSNSPR